MMYCLLYDLKSDLVEKKEEQILWYDVIDKLEEKKDIMNEENAGYDLDIDPDDDEEDQEHPTPQRDKT